jgi:oxygen-independent coproporphyrinogen-3 oxidase
MLEAGYHVSSGNELVRNPQTDRFIYRDNLFRGSDVLALGVSSFGHFQGVHYQNLDAIEDYQTVVQSGALPINRALRPTPLQRLIREFVLQLKEGVVQVNELDSKFDVQILEQFATPLSNQQQAGFLETDADTVRLTRKGLLQADSLLPEYFEKQFRQVRYT